MCLRVFTDRLWNALACSCIPASHPSCCNRRATTSSLAAAAGKQAPEAVELGLRATGASYDPKSKALIISARPLAGQPLETAVRKLSVVTALFQPMTFPVFRAAAPPNASNAINTSDPASVAAHPENFIAESKFPVVTDAPRAPPRGANATPPLTYTIVSRRAAPWRV